jgi:hypothetical protein
MNAHCEQIELLKLDEALTVATEAKRKPKNTEYGMKRSCRKSSCNIVTIY